jgi:hypothetical protein
VGLDAIDIATGELVEKQSFSYFFINSFGEIIIPTTAMNASVAKKTQDTLGKVIKKPPLTEKLLTKPPFRYLHDIFSEVSDYFTG